MLDALARPSEPLWMSLLGARVQERLRHARGRLGRVMPERSWRIAARSLVAMARRCLQRRVGALRARTARSYRHLPRASNRTPADARYAGAAVPTAMSRRSRRRPRYRIPRGRSERWRPCGRTTCPAREGALAAARRNPLLTLPHRFARLAAPTPGRPGRRGEGEPIRHPRAFLRQVIINQRKMQLRSERRHPATSYDEIMATADGSGSSGIGPTAGPPSASTSSGARSPRSSCTSCSPWRGAPAGCERCAGSSNARPTRSYGITHRQYARLLERANSHQPQAAAYLAGDWCRGHAARFARLAANGATPAEAQDAREHLDACPSCRTAYETFTRLHPSA